MTNDEIRIAIAEDQRWTHGIDRSILWCTSPTGSRWEEIDATKWLPTSKLLLRQCPNYPEDLNAMHEVEKALWLKSQNWIRGGPSPYDAYVCRLAMVCYGKPVFDNGTSLVSVQEILHYVCRATARQRAEAYLRVKGLFKDLEPKKT